MLETIKVGRREVEVLDVPGLSNPDLHGLFRCDQNGARIELAEELDGLARLETLAHEIIHSWLYFSGVDNVLKDDEEELICSALQQYLGQLIEQCIEEGMKWGGE